MSLRKFIRRGIGLLGFLWFVSVYAYPIPDSIAVRLQGFVSTLEQFGKALPQEKVYLHFDNTGYYQGDQIWFQCYVVTSEFNRPTAWSKTLYVELLNPGGEIVSRQILPIRNGRCQGNFTLTHLPFYSGFYEVRAYTKYMLNFGEATVFSRIFPVFDKPDSEGDYTQKEICRHPGKYPQKREKTRKEKKLNLRFYPEGGTLIRDVPVRVAFEATDAFGNPVDVSGCILNKEKEVVSTFRTSHEGKGVFTYVADTEEVKAEVVWRDKKYRFSLPEAEEQGFAFSVDNLSIPDSLAITVQKNRFTAAQVLGVAVMSRGKLYNFCMLTVKRNQPFSFRLDKKNLPVGVSQLVLFDKAGQVLADRLVFVGKPDTLSLAVRTDKEQYFPYDSICISFEVNDPQGQPAQTLLSVSVRDGREEVESRHSMLTDLLLMSEIKGYVRRPSWYFESDDTLHRRALDELLMVQGWRRYEWKHWAGVEPFELKYLPEQGIELHGQVVSMVRSKPRPDVQVTSFLTKRGEEDNPTDQNTPCFDVFTTDSSGRFSFISQVEGKWNLILSVSEKGKKKDHRIVLDRVFHPEPRRYPMAELQVHISGDEKVSLPDTQLNDTVFMQENMEQLFKAYEDSLRKLGMDEKIHRIDEVVVKAKKLDKAAEVYKTRTKSIAYYDVASEMDDIQDRNGFIGDDIHELMINMNSEFYREHSPGGQEYLFYKGRMVLFAINYERTYHNEMDYNKYRLLPLEAIKSVYISEDFGTICRYADPRFTPINIDKLYRCVVLIETYPEDQISVKGGKGVRKTWLEGYSEVKDFYQPDYRVLPKENDYRRTLYWNPALSTDEQGKAYICFYNNSRCKYPRITVETLTEDGKIGVFRQ